MASSSDSLTEVQRGLLELVDKHLVLFAPKTSHGLLLDYPELASMSEFKDLGKYDMMFVWAYACRCSPFLSINDKNLRIEACVHYAYPKESRHARLSTLLGKFPEKIANAVSRMERFNLEARVIEYVLLRQVRENIVYIAMKDVACMADDDQKRYFEIVKLNQSILADQRTRIEGMDLGVAEQGDTLYKEAVDVWKLYMQDHDPDQDPD